jgi:hypothetical protein
MEQSLFLRKSLIFFSCCVAIASITLLGIPRSTADFASRPESASGIKQIYLIASLIASWIVYFSASRMWASRTRTQLLVFLVNTIVISFLSFRSPIFKIYEGCLAHLIVGHYCFFLGAQLGYFVFFVKPSQAPRFSLRTVMVGVIAISIVMMFYFLQTNEFVFSIASAASIVIATASITIRRRATVKEPGKF